MEEIKPDKHILDLLERREIAEEEIKIIMGVHQDILEPLKIIQ